MRVRNAACFCLILFALPWAPATLAQGVPCPGGRLVTGFELTVQPPGETDPVPLADVNNLDQGDILHYTPQALPAVWHNSARVATILIPASNDASAELTVFTSRADRPAAWRVPDRIGAVAFLFGPNGLNANKTRSLLSKHPELQMHFIAYAEETSRVEALVALLARYENSPPGSLSLDTLLKQYSATYGVSMPKANPALSPDQQAAVLLTAVAPPTAQQSAPSPNSLSAGSTSTAAALASLYFGPIMGLATDTMPLFRALHQSLFPGTQFQGAFAQTHATPARLCAANVAPPPNQHTVYIWMSKLPGGSVPAVELAKNQGAVVPTGAQASIEVTCASVAQLRDLGRARAWKLVPASGVPVPISVDVAPGPLRDTLTLDLTHVSPPAGDYHLAALWDWTPLQVQGAVAVRPPTPLANARLNGEPPVVAGGGDTPVIVTGADFSFVNKVELLPKAIVLPFTLSADRQSLTVKLATAALAPGAYQLRLRQSAGEARTLPLTVEPPDPVVEPLRGNLGEKSQEITLRGSHLERVARLACPGANVTLDPLPATVPTEGLHERTARLALPPDAAAGQTLNASIYVTGRPQPLAKSAAIDVLAPRPSIGDVHQTVNAGETVALVPGELPADATVNFAFTVHHAPPTLAVRLQCQSPDQQLAAATLHPGENSGALELAAAGSGLFYLAAIPGTVGRPGCQLQMTIADDAVGDSDAFDLGVVVQLPRIKALTLSNQGPAPGEFAGELHGDNLQLIARTGWSPDVGLAVTGIPMRVTGAEGATQTLAIVMPWPPPAPHAPLYIWLRGETHGRATTVTP